MKTILTFVLALLTVSVLAIPDAEAKRMGGGSNLGRQTTMPRQAQAPAAAPAQAQRPGAAAPAAGGASRWLGPLAGLAAGGLLAAHVLRRGLRGHGRHGLDAHRRPGHWRLLPVPGPAQARRHRSHPGHGAHGPRRDPHRRRGGHRGLWGHGPASTRSRPLRPRHPAASEAPAWFDGPGFAEGAKNHYIRLQAAWDQADWNDIRTYTTPALFAELQAEHRRSATEGQETEVVRINAELLQVQRDGDLVLASVRFSGLIREEAKAPAEPFDEVWHVQHAWASPRRRLADLRDSADAGLGTSQIQAHLVIAVGWGPHDGLAGVSTGAPRTLAQACHPGVAGLSDPRGIR